MSTSPTSANPSLANCKPDPAAAIAAVPPGGVFDGSGCYLTTGITISQPITINGGVYNDPVNTNTGDETVHPIIRIKDTSQVTIENASLVGANPGGGFHRQMVRQAGLDILSSSGVSIVNVAVSDTFGDGMTVFTNYPVDKNPTSNLTVSGFSVTNAGRQGITMATVTDSVFNNVAINSATGDGWDFESDAPGIGSGNVTISNSRSVKGVRLIEALQGPISFDNYQGQRHVSLLQEAAASGRPVTFNGGSLLLPNRNHGASLAGITVRGPGHLVLNSVDVGRLPASWAPTGLAWSVTGGGSLTLFRSLVAPPLGTSDQGSTVTTS